MRKQGETGTSSASCPKIGPTALLGLLYTIVLMFAMQGDRIVACRSTWCASRCPAGLLRDHVRPAFWLSRRLGFAYETTASLSFTAAGNNFELAIAVAVALFGISSGEALAGVVGPLIEVPALLRLVYLSLWARRRYFPGDVPPATSPGVSP